MFRFCCILLHKLIKGYNVKNRLWVNNHVGSHVATESKELCNQRSTCRKHVCSLWKLGPAALLDKLHVHFLIMISDSGEGIIGQIFGQIDALAILFLKQYQWRDNYDMTGNQAPPSEIIIIKYKAQVLLLDLKPLRWGSYIQMLTCYMTAMTIPTVCHVSVWINVFDTDKIWFDDGTSWKVRSLFNLLQLIRKEALIFITHIKCQSRLKKPWIHENNFS